MTLANLKISERVRLKIQNKHHVSIEEIEECFMNRTGGLLTDKRLNNMTNPPTQWFIAETDKGRSLKIVFIENGNMYEIKTAFEPNKTEVNIYEKFA